MSEPIDSSLTLSSGDRQNKASHLLLQDVSVTIVKPGADCVLALKDA